MTHACKLKKEFRSKHMETKICDPTPANVKKLSENSHKKFIPNHYQFQMFYISKLGFQSRSKILKASICNLIPTKKGVSIQ